MQSPYSAELIVFFAHLDVAPTILIMRIIRSEKEEDFFGVGGINHGFVLVADEQAIRIDIQYG